MASWLILLIKQFLDIIRYLMVGYSIFNNERIDKDNKKEIIIITIFILLIYIIFKEILLDIWTSLNLIICLITLAILFRKSGKKAIVILIVSLLVTTLIEQFLILIINYRDPRKDLCMFIIFEIISFLLVIIFYFIISKIKGLKNITFLIRNIPSYIYMNIVFGFSATLFPMFLITKYKEYVDRKLVYIISGVSYLNIAVVIVSIIIFMKNRKEKEYYYLENKLKEKTLNLQENYYQKLIDNYSNIRQFKHDLKGHLNVINRLLTNCNYNQAAEYIGEISKIISKNDVYKTNNIYISTILNSFDQTFKDENIKFELSYYITNHIIMESMDICSLFYNLISNAIESNQKITGERYIKLYIAEIKNNIVIKLLNPVDKDFNLDIIKEYRTTKQDKENHGFGLITINNIISKYRGSIDYDVMDTNLIIDIVLFNTLKQQD